MRRAVYGICITTQATSKRETGKFSTHSSKSISPTPRHVIRPLGLVLVTPTVTTGTARAWVLTPTLAFAIWIVGLSFEHIPDHQFSFDARVGDGLENGAFCVKSTIVSG